MIDPNDFVISRKRKKYKFAKFANSPLCFELEDWDKRSVDVVEMGAGTALFSVELAEKYPHKTYLAVDVKADRLQKGAYEAEARGLTNVWFLRARADQLADIATPGTLEAIWLTFADPFPKKRSAGRRMTHPTFLSLYKHALKTEGVLHIKHDNPSFFEWSLEQLVSGKWAIRQLNFNLHDVDVECDATILTTYEQRWLNEERSTKYAAAIRPTS